MFCAMFTLTFELTSVYMLYYPLSARARVRRLRGACAFPSCGPRAWGWAARFKAIWPRLYRYVYVNYVQRGIKVTLHIRYS